MYYETPTAGYSHDILYALNFLQEVEESAASDGDSDHTDDSGGSIVSMEACEWDFFF